MPSAKDILVNTLLGPGSSFRGDLVVDGFVRIDGDLRGSVRASGKIVVGESARLDASIVAKSAIIGGVVKGDVYVLEQLTVLEGGVIIGDVFAPRMDADHFVIIHGEVEVPGSGVAAEDAMLSFMQRRGATIRPVGFDASPGKSQGRIPVPGSGDGT